MVNSITVNGIITEDFINYKKPSMTLQMPICTFKCNKDAGKPVCQNMELKDASTICMPINSVLEKYYIHNDITKAVCFQGLEPFDSFDELYDFIKEFSSISNDDIVIYTGYMEEEIKDKVNLLIELLKNNTSKCYSKRINTLIIKYGRYIPDDKSHFDEILGVNLASSNQYAKEYSN